MLFATVTVKIISAVYKIPLTSYIGATGRGYFSIAYNLCLPIHALTMGAFPLALTKLVSSYYAKGNTLKIKALRKASKRLFFIVGILGTFAMLLLAKPYANVISSSPKSIYTIIALAPSVFFSCLSASHRAFAEGYLDMKATAVSQVIEALFKMVFGLLFARLSMSYLFDFYSQYGTVFGVNFSNDFEALSAIYPLSSAFAMLGATIGSVVSYVYSAIYVTCKYNSFPPGKANTNSAFKELLGFSAPLIAATVIQSFANFLDSSSVQYFLALCDKSVLQSRYHCAENDVYTYVFGLYSSALDFKNLVPSITMALGVTAVPAVSCAYESGSQRFSPLMTSIFKYTVILSAGGGIALCLFGKDILTLFYSRNNPDIVSGCEQLLFLFGMTSLPCAAASTSVFCVQALGYSKLTMAPFAVSALVRVGVNYFLVSNENINILGSAYSNFAGFVVILVWNMAIIKKKTNIRFNYIDIFIKPLICAALAYFVTDCIRESLFCGMQDVLVFILSCGFCCFFYLVLLWSLKCICTEELRDLK